MPEFTNPFIGNVPRQISQSELVRAVMLDIAAELEAVHVYRAQAESTTDEGARKVLLDIALEEVVHAGEFMSLLYRLDPTAASKVQEGFAEVQDLLGSPVQSADAEPAEEQSPASPAPQGLTVGSLIGA